MNIIVTGYSGFLGSHLTERLTGHTLYLINSSVCNLTNQKDTYDYFSSIKNVDMIFHLAAKTKAGDYCLYHQGEQWIDNQLLNTNVLGAWHKHHPQAKMVTFGTSCGYDRDLEVKSEELYLTGCPEPTLFTYAMCKRMLLAGLMALNAQYGMKYVYLIPSTLYGTRFTKDDSHFIFDLIKKIVNGTKNGTEVILWGDGYQTRELIYIDDAIDIILNSLKYDNSTFNVCSSKEYTIRQYAQIICDYVDYDINKIKFDDSKYVGAKSKTLDSTKINTLGLIKNHTPIKTGIETCIDYYKTL